jgi:HSP20 family molecular chaperone IbpA
MNLNPVKTTVSKPMVIGLVTLTLVLGIVIGVAAEKLVNRNSALAPAEPVAGAAKPLIGGTTPPLLPDPFANDPFDAWDPFREMRSLQAEMDEMFRRSIARFRQSPRMSIFTDDAGYSLSLDVRELKDRYEVRGFLPDAKAADAKVNLQGNRLEVEVTHRQTAKGNNNAPDTVTEWGRYIQSVELAGNLKSDQMKVERKEHELLITIPKA